MGASVTAAVITAVSMYDQGTTAAGASGELTTELPGPGLPGP